MGGGACGPSPEAAVAEALDAFAAGDGAALARALDPEYADGLGGPDRVVADAEAWARRYPVRRIRLEGARAAEGATSRALASVEAEVLVELEGDSPSVRATGPIRVELVRRGVFRVRTGLLGEVRDALELLDRRRAALEANDADALGALLHPSYRDGGFDRALVVERLRADLAGRVVRVAPIAQRIELRPDLVHVDEHVQLALDGEPQPPSVARLTLARSAGRLRIRAGLRASEAPSGQPENTGGSRP